MFLTSRFYSFQAEDLFCDVYYQCTHLVGQETSIKKDALLAFMKDLFEFDDAKCKTLVDSAKQKPVSAADSTYVYTYLTSYKIIALNEWFLWYASFQAPKMLLKVDVVEAKDLSSKDATGMERRGKGPSSRVQ